SVIGGFWQPLAAGLAVRPGRDFPRYETPRRSGSFPMGRDAAFGALATINRFDRNTARNASPRRAAFAPDRAIFRHALAPAFAVGRDIATALRASSPLDATAGAGLIAVPFQ